MRVWNVKFDL